MEIQFDIPSQPLGVALQRYASDTGTSVFFDHALIVGKFSMPIRGALLPEDALLSLIGGAGLQVRRTSPLAFAIVAAPVVEATDGNAASALPAVDVDRSESGQDPQRARYLQAALERALCSTDQTRPGTYRALIRLWLDRDGRVQRGGVLGGTGLVRRDRAIDRVLQTLQVPSVPTQLATDLPFTILLVPRTDGAIDICNNLAEEH